MVLGMPKAQGQVQNLGPTGEHVAENLQRLRGAMSYRELSERLEALGRPIPVLGLSRIESKARRVDADDLVALAIALDVSPVRLLLPPRTSARAKGYEGVQLAPEVERTWVAAWRWAVGDQPLMERHKELPLDDVRVRDFITENRPFEDESEVREAMKFLKSRVPAPFEATITDKEANLHRRVSWDEWHRGEVNRG
jgi:transcriptional regulator with XRE-family HTH domain